MFSPILTHAICDSMWSYILMLFRSTKIVWLVLYATNTVNTFNLFKQSRVLVLNIAWSLWTLHCVKENGQKQDAPLQQVRQSRLSCFGMECLVCPPWQTSGGQLWMMLSAQTSMPWTMGCYEPCLTWLPWCTNSKATPRPELPLVNTWCWSVSHIRTLSRTMRCSWEKPGCQWWQQQHSSYCVQARVRVTSHACGTVHGKSHRPLDSGKTGQTAADEG